jgi:hypothetical protein
MKSYELHPTPKLEEAQRMMFLLSAEKIRVGKDGTITLESGRGFGVGSNRYGCDALYDYVGKHVVVRFDPQAMHEPVRVFQLNGKRIADADCIQAAGFDDRNKAREHARARRRFIKNTKKAAAAQVDMDLVSRTMLSLTPEEAHEEESVTETAAETETDTVIEFPFEEAPDESAFSTAVEMLKGLRRGGI